MRTGRIVARKNCSEICCKTFPHAFPQVFPRHPFIIALFYAIKPASFWIKIKIFFYIFCLMGGGSLSPIRLLNNRNESTLHILQASETRDMILFRERNVQLLPFAGGVKKNPKWRGIMKTSIFQGEMMRGRGAVISGRARKRECKEHNPF